MEEQLRNTERRRKLNKYFVLVSSEVEGVDEKVTGTKCNLCENLTWKLLQKNWTKQE